MFYDFSSYLNKYNFPTTECRHSGIVGEGFQVSLDINFDPDTYAGFLPVNGKLSVAHRLDLKPKID